MEFLSYWLYFLLGQFLPLLKEKNRIQAFVVCFTTIRMNSENKTRHEGVWFYEHLQLMAYFSYCDNSPKNWIKLNWKQVNKNVAASLKLDDSNRQVVNYVNFLLLGHFVMKDNKRYFADVFFNHLSEKWSLNRCFD